jgi:hypothetical protein
MHTVYPDDDVLTKRSPTAWRDETYAVIAERISTDHEEHVFFRGMEWLTLCALCGRIVPQPSDRLSPMSLAAMVDQKMHRNHLDGFRDVRLPRMQDAWRLGLAAIEAEARQRYAKSFHELMPDEQEDLLSRVQRGEVYHAAWAGMPPEAFFTHRLLHDIVSAHDAHAAGPSETGFCRRGSGGHVAMDLGRRDPWRAHTGRASPEAACRR